LCGKPKLATYTPTVAAIMEVAPKTTETNDLVAAIFPAVTLFTNTTNLADNLELSILSMSALLKEKHHVWQCTLINLSGHIQMKMCMLIDSGTHLVLVCPDLVTQLWLPILPLE